MLEKFINEESKERLSWQEIVEKYPETWVILKDCEMEHLCLIKAATVLGSCSSRYRLEVEEEIVLKKLPYRMKSTARGMFVWDRELFE